MPIRAVAGPMRAGMARGYAFAVILGFSALVAVRSPAQCELYEFTAPSPGAGDSFGLSMDFNGEVLVVGGRYSAATYVRESFGTATDPTDDKWVLQQEFTTSQIFDDFGSSVGLASDHLIIGAPFHGGAFGPGNGEAYIYRRNEAVSRPSNNIWQLSATLTPTLSSGSPVSFGKAVIVNNSFAAVGSPLGALSTVDPKHGLVYVYRRDSQGSVLSSDDVWLEQTVLSPAQGLPGDRFGASVAFVGSDLLIGAVDPLGPSVVYYFRHDAAGTPAETSDDTWVEQQRIEAPLTPVVSRFGIALSVHGGTVLIGSHGAAFEFERSDNGTPGDATDDVWVHVASVLADDAGALEQFGHSVSLDSNSALVGAPLAGDGAVGVAYQFSRASQRGQWLAVAKLSQSQPDYAQQLGTGVLIAEDHLLAGESGEFTGAPAADSPFGGVTVFARAMNPWSYIDASPESSAASACMLGTGSLHPGTPIGLIIRDAPSNSMAFLIIGSATVNQPFKGGVLVPVPERLVILMTSVSGDAIFTGTWPTGTLAGLVLFVQAWIPYDTVPAGFVSSNALEVSIR